MRFRQQCRDPLFNERGELTRHWHVVITRRLDADGCTDVPSRCRLLAGLINVDDMAVWAMTMWNTAPGPDMAGKLARWVRSGMPLRVGKRDLESHTHPPCS